MFRRLVTFLFYIISDNKREQVHPTNICSMHSIVPCISYKHRDVKCSTPPTRYTP